MLRTADGLELAAEVWPGGDDWVVLAHGFTVSTAFPPLRRVAARLSRVATVLAYDARGHGRSGGLSTLGDREVLDVDAAVAAARAGGAAWVATVGFSMGAAAVVRHAARVEGYGLREEPDAVVSVSGTAGWSRWATATPRLRALHLLAGTGPGRLVARRRLGTRVQRPPAGAVLPVAPLDAVSAVRVPLLVVHGTRDRYLAVAHAQALAARSGAPLWLEDGLGHAELAVGPQLVDRLGEHLAALPRRGRPGARIDR